MRCDVLPNGLIIHFEVIGCLDEYRHREGNRKMSRPKNYVMLCDKIMQVYTHGVHTEVLCVSFYPEDVPDFHWSWRNESVNSKRVL